MSTIDTIIRRARVLASRKGWSRARVAREAGLHANTLRDLDSDDWTPAGDTLRKLEQITALHLAPLALDEPEAPEIAA